MNQKEEFLKKVRYLLFAIFLCAPLTAVAQGDIAINEENFPDENFRAYLLEQSYGQDGIITEEEIKGITYISVDDKNIGSLKGIEYFTALTRLDCYSNQLTSLDVSQNTALTYLECGSNQLTSLDVSQNTALTTLGCDYNQLTSLDVSQNTALIVLFCSNNQLTSLDVSQNTALTRLYCPSNRLTSLDVSQALTSLNCGFNQLTSLDVSKNTALTSLDCHGNQLTSLDISQNTALTLLGCGNNQLTSLDVSQNTALTSLRCEQNQLTSLDVSQNTALTMLYCLSNQLTSLNVSQNTALTELWCWGNQLSSLDVTDCISLTSIYCYGNLIRKEAMGAFINSLPQNTTGENHSLYIVGKYNDDNVYSIEQVAAAKAKGWVPYYSDGTEYKGFEIPEGIAIDEAHFPDENFRNYLLEQSYGQDGIITEEEIKGITDINVGSRNIGSLKGIEYFTALTTLYCDINQLTSLDVSQNTALTTLYCSINQLTSLDVSQNTALTSLSCGTNQLTSLDVSQNTALTSLDCIYNQLTSLDVSQNTALTSLSCYINSLTSLDVSQNTALTSLNCGYNQLTSLDVSQNTALTTLKCYGNQLTSLDISQNTALTKLYCDNNQLTSLDVSKNTALTSLECHGNQLTSLDVSKNTALTELGCYRNQIKGEAMDLLISSLPENVSGTPYTLYLYHSPYEGNVCTKAQVAAAKAKGWTPYYYNNGWKEYEGSDAEPEVEEPEVEQPKGIAIDEVHFPDENFRNYLLEQSYGQDGIITEEEIKGITILSVFGKNIRSLKGIEYFTALTTLDCSYNPLTSLDISQNTALTTLNCSYNQLTSLDVSQNTALTLLWCEQNQLTSLYVSQNTALTELQCYHNQIKGEAMDLLISSLPENVSGAPYTLLLYYSPNEGNVCTKAQVAAAKAKGWTPYYNNSGWKEYEGSDDEPEVEQPDGIAIDEAHFPDKAFRNWLLAQKYGEDSVLTEEEIAGISAMKLSDIEVSNLKGIELFTALEGLICEKTALTDLDLSGCAALFELICSENPNLKSLTVSGCLKFLHCSGNGMLTSLDVSDCTALMMIEGMNNKLTSLNVSGCTALQYLYCNNNQLKSLDVSGCTLLEELYCQNNLLTSLTASKCEALTQLNCSMNQIAGEAMDAFIGSLPIAEGAKLYVYDNKNTAEGNVCTKKQVAAAKEKGWTTYCADLAEYEGSDADENTEDQELAAAKAEATEALAEAQAVKYDESVFDGKIEDINAAIKDLEAAYEALKDKVENSGITSDDILGELNAIASEVNSLETLSKEATTAKETVAAYFSDYDAALKKYEESIDAATTVVSLNNLKASLATAMASAQAKLTEASTKVSDISAELEALKDRIAKCSDAVDDYEGDSGNDDDDNNTGDDNGADDDDTGDDNEDPETPDVVIDEETFPDEAFRDILSELVGGEAGNVLTEEEIKEITSLDISESGVSDLTGLEYLTALTELVCEGNKLESLDVSKNTELTMIDCSRNQIKGEGMDAFISSLPQKTAATRATTAVATEVYVLRVYDSIAEDEGNVCTKEQVEAINVKGWTPYYYNGKEWLEYTGYDDEATGISWLGTGDGSVSVYNMAGQKVNLPANAKKGVYIVNGKKVVVK